MAYKTTKNIRVFMGATLEDGSKTMLQGEVNTQKTYYPVKELNERINLKNTFKSLSEVCRSSRDIEILGEILERTDITNKILLPNLSELAEEFNISRQHLNTLLNRAEDANLLYKINTRHYMLNPYKIMGAKASSCDYETQEMIQVSWKELTGLITELETEQLLKLSDYLGLDIGLPPTSYCLSIAAYYNKHKTITDKQRAGLVRAGFLK